LTSSLIFGVLDSIVSSNFGSGELIFIFLKDFSNTYIDKPILKVAGLNPHAGEEGILGNEEKDWLNSAMISWNKKNRDIQLFGPLSPDSCWNSSQKLG